MISIKGMTWLVKSGAKNEPVLKARKFRPNWLPEGSFLMGRSVFSPVREAEEMRNTVNRRLTETPSESRFGSRLDTPIEEPYTTPSFNTPFDATRSDSHPNCYSSFPASRSRSQSRIHSVLSPVTVNQVHSPRLLFHSLFSFIFLPYFFFFLLELLVTSSILSLRLKEGAFSNSVRKTVQFY